MVTLLFLISFILTLECSESELDNSKGTSEYLTKYKDKQYKINRDNAEDPNLECEIPPLEEEDLTHFRRKRMIALHGRVCLEDYPFMVSLRYNHLHICTGAMIHNQFIMTISDCVKDVEDLENPHELTVRVGSPFRDVGGRLLSVIQVILHPRNGTGDYSYRLVVIKTNVHITTTLHMAPAELPFPRMKIPDFGHIVVTGYGNDKETGELTMEYDSQWIRRLYVRVLSTEECMERIDLATANGLIDGKFHDDYMCVDRYNDTIDDLYLCNGDLGVPLMHYSQPGFTSVLIGLSVTNMEYCLNNSLNNGTDGKLQPGIFIKVQDSRGWIESIFKNEATIAEEGETSIPTECELVPSYNENYRYLRRKKRLTTETDLACLEDYPYTVSVRLHGIHWCGGAIIGDDWVLTSAQCFDDVDKEDVTVRMGSVFRDYGGRIVSVVALAKHPQYKKGEDYPAHNLAMVQINMPVMPNARMQIVKLIPPITVRVGRWGGENVVTGYGSVKSNLLEEGVDQELRRMKVARIPLSDCQKAYEGITEIKEDHVCLKSVTGGVNLCTGDLGNPAVQFSKHSKGGTLFALAMFPGTEGCNSSRPFIFTKIRPSRRWIDTVLREGPPAETEPPPTTTTTKAPAALRQGDVSDKLIRWFNFTSHYITKWGVQCIIHPKFQIDLRKVNLTAHRRRRRKRMTTTGKHGLACLEDYPFTVAILKDDKEVICNGAIVAKQWVLTAAMCLERCNIAKCYNLLTHHQLSIRMGSILGSTGGRLVPIIGFHVHHEFDPDQWLVPGYYNRGGIHMFPVGNLAMLKFNIPYRSSALMQRVVLPDYEYKDSHLYEYPLEDGRYVVTSFGGKNLEQPDGGLNDLRATVVKPRAMYGGGSFYGCSDLLDKAYGYDKRPWYYAYTHVCMLSIEPNITFCIDDAGAPLVRYDHEHFKPVLEGIFVYSPVAHPNGPCLPKSVYGISTPGVFVKIRFYVDWIKHILKQDRDDPVILNFRPFPQNFPLVQYSLEDLKKLGKR